MQDLSSEDKKITTQKLSKNNLKIYPRIVFGHKNVGFPPIGFQKFT